MKKRRMRAWLALAVFLWGTGLQAAGAEAAPPSAEEILVQSDVSEAAHAGEVKIDPGIRPDFVNPLLEVALAELGYTEGPNNRTKFGEWAGDPNAAWCAEFLCWCVGQLDQKQGTKLLTTVYPNYGGQNVGRDWFIARGRFVYRKGNCPDWGYQWLLGENRLMKKNDYIPRPGDWVFFSYNEAGDTEHVAMVEYSAKDAGGNVVIHVIEGNNPSQVARNSYYLNNSQVLGFGVCEDVVGTTMRSGNRGDKVRRLQQDLLELGFLTEKHITGAFGGNTKSAVADFQRTMHSKTATGIADMDTQIEMANRLKEKEFNDMDTWLVEE